MFKKSCVICTFSYPVRNFLGGTSYICGFEMSRVSCKLSGLKKKPVLLKEDVRKFIDKEGLARYIEQSSLK